MRKGFIVRDRSLTSFPSRQMSANQLRTQNSVAFQTFRTKFIQDSKLNINKDQQVPKLKAHLDYALQMAVAEAIESSKAKQQSMRSTKTKIHIEKKYLQVTQQLNGQKVQRMKMEDQLAGMEYELNKEQEEKKKLAEKQEHTERQFSKVKKQLAKIPSLEEKVTQIQPLKARIKVLENKIREQKMKGSEVFETNKQLLKEIQELKQKIKLTKPQEQQHLQRIALLQRINLQLQRKMEDFYRREQEYRKEITRLKSQLTKMTADRNKYKQLYETTYNTLQEKLKYIEELEEKLAQKIKQNQHLAIDLDLKTKESAQNAQKLVQTIEFYKDVAEQNERLKKRNTALQQNENQMRRAIASHLKVSEQTNLYIIQRNGLILKFEQQKKHLQEGLEELEKRFMKLDRLFEEGSARGQNEIKQSYYNMLKEKDKLSLEIKQHKEEMSVKVLQFGEQRDYLQRKINSYQAPLPQEETLFQAILSDKTQAILMLESSNDELIKIKKELSDRVRDVEKQNETIKRQMQTLRLKAAQLFKTKKQLQQAKERAQRYQQMIEQQRVQIADLNSQLDVMRTGNAESEQKLFALGIEIKNLNLKIMEYENIMKQMDVEYLNAKKIENERNAHIISDAMQKMQNGINSLSYYFSCCFCDQLLSNPITLAPCGHNYCTNPKCKDAYGEYCYECDTGQPIQKVFPSKFLKQAAGKYKFLTIVLKEAQTNLIKAKTQAQI